MADLCLDEFTDHGHCGVLDDDGRVDNDATLDRYVADGRGPGPGRGARRRHQRDDGRPGRGRPGRPGRGRLHRHGDPGLLRQVRLRVLRPVPRSRGFLAAPATG